MKRVRSESQESDVVAPKRKIPKLSQLSLKQAKKLDNNSLENAITSKSITKPIQQLLLTDIARVHAENIVQQLFKVKYPGTSLGQLNDDIEAQNMVLKCIETFARRRRTCANKTTLIRADLASSLNDRRKSRKFRRYWKPVPFSELINTITVKENIDKRTTDGCGYVV
jgi:hypothetical protein